MPITLLITRWVTISIVPTINMSTLLSAMGLIHNIILQITCLNILILSIHTSFTHTWIILLSIMVHRIIGAHEIVN
ncbi:hypothetical protein MXB_5662 [Myxobolus squamalis]|nr:hypothetical protein MXB_5662 [Myxobolus squamalis]